MLRLTQLYFKTHYKKGALLCTQAEFPKGSSMKDLLYVILLLRQLYCTDIRWELD